MERETYPLLDRTPREDVNPSDSCISVLEHQDNKLYTMSALSEDPTRFDAYEALAGLPLADEQLDLHVLEWTRGMLLSIML